MMQVVKSFKSVTAGTGGSGNASQLEKTKSQAEGANAKLLAAAVLGSKSGVKDALQQGAELDAQNTKGETALILASIRGFMNVVSFLKQARANPLLRDQDNFTALERAEAARAKETNETKKADYLLIAQALEAYETEWAKAQAEMTNPALPFRLIG
jgi:hypothetical protein